MQQILKPIGGMNIDVDEKYISPTAYKFARNLYRSVNRNTNNGTGSDIGQGNDSVVVTPIPSNRQFCTLDLPEGDNQCIGSLEFEELGEVYIFNWNSNSQSGIYRLNIDAGTCQLVDRGACYPFDLNYPITEDNCHLRLTYNTSIQGATPVFKNLIFTDRQVYQYDVDVETAIATNQFDDVTYPYFTAFYPQYDKCEWRQLACRPIYACPTVVESEDINDEGINYLLDKTWQFAVVAVYYNGKQSVLSPFSSLAYVGGGACNKSGRGLATCFDITIEAGSWMVEKIKIYFRNCNGNVTDITNPTDWYLYDTLYKYDSSNPANVGVPFWERVVTLPNYGTLGGFENNYFVYRFCGDKQCTPVSVNETNRVYDDLPITSGALHCVADNLVSGDNKKGRNPIPTSTLQKIKFTVTPPTGDDICPIGFHKVSGDIILWNPYKNNNQFIHKDDDVGVVAWGGVGIFNGINAPYVNTVGTDYRQTFADNAEGFLVGLRGTGIVVRTTQRKIHADGTIISEGIENTTGDGNRNRIARNIDSNNFFVQHFEFYAPDGYNILEVYSHNASVNDSDVRNTSTFFAGFQTTYGNLNYGASELEFTINGADYDITSLIGYIQISDLTDPDGALVAEASSYYGYLKEKDGVVPIEMADFRITKNPSGDPYIPDSGNPSFRADKTDYNGFYWFTVSKGLFASTGAAQFYGYQGCTVFDMVDFTIPASPPNQANIQNVEQTNEFDVNHLYKDCANIRVEGYIKDCDGNGLPDITVVYQHLRSVVTDGDGKYSFKVHAEVDYEANTGSVPPRILFTPQNGTCFIVTCESCSLVLGSLIGVTPDFADCANMFVCPVYVYTATDKLIKYANSVLRGLKSGTTYQAAIVLKDFAGRAVDAQTDDSYYFTTPFITDTGGIFAPSTLTWEILSALQFESWVESFSILITKKKESYLQWVGSKVTFVDAKGTEVTPTSATYIKLQIDGLRNYNTLNNFRANTTYQFIEGDRIRFIDDGSQDSAGLYTSAANGSIIDLQVRALQDGNTLLIDYDSRLQNLQAGNWVELYHPSQCLTVTQFYQRCPTYPVIDGEVYDFENNPIPLNTPQTINTFDTYFIYRAIPQKDLACAADAKDNAELALCADTVFITYHPYEHYAPSDFWGVNCQDIGRVFVENKDARQTTRQDEISWSDAFLSNGTINGFGTWRSENVKDYFSQDFGAIRHIFVYRDVMVVICENDWFVVQVNPKYVTVGKDGTLIANPESFLSAAVPKVGSIFGCTTDAIKFLDDKAVWYDERRSALVVCNYTTASDVTIGQTKSFFLEKTSQYRAYNQTNENFAKYFTVMGYDPKNNYILLTWFVRAQQDPFINNSREVGLDFDNVIDVPEQSETIIYDVTNGDFLTCPAFMPEYYSQSKTGLTQQVYIAMKNGQPYLHNDNNVSTYMNFFGVDTDQTIEVVMNFEPTVRKIPLAIDIESNGGVGYFVDRVLIGIDGVESEIPMVRMKQEGTCYHAEFLRDKNSTGGLYKGKTLQGYYARIRLVRDNTLNNSKLEFDNAKRKMYNELDHVIVKFSLSERTGK